MKSQYKESKRLPNRLLQEASRPFESQQEMLTYIEYRLISKKGEGTFSEVLKAQSIKTGKYVAIKCMKNHFDTIE